MFDFAQLEQDVGHQAAPPGPGQGCILLQPVGSLGSRLMAIASGILLAADLQRDLVLRWRRTRDCNCHWHNLVATASGPRLLKEGRERGALSAGEELIKWWDFVCIASGRAEFQHLALEFFNQHHAATYSEGAAYLLDPSEPKWCKVPRLGGSHGELVPDFMRVACLCVRASGTFYPAQDRTLATGELSSALATLLPSDSVSRHLWQLPRSIISVHARQSSEERLEGNAVPDADSAVSLLLEPLTSYLSRMQANPWSDHRFFLATDDAEVEGCLLADYGSSLFSYDKRSADPAAPEAAEDAFVDLLMMARAAGIIALRPSTLARAAALLGGVQLKVLCQEGQHLPVKAAGPQPRGADPTEPTGPFFLVGTWSDWKEFLEFEPPEDLCVGSFYDRSYSALIRVRDDATQEEFQIVQDRDWQQRFHPDGVGGSILGPSNKHGVNWCVGIPRGCSSLRVLWDPRGQRRLTWRFVSHVGVEWFEETQAAGVVGASPYWLAGSWNDWKDFTELKGTREGLLQPTLYEADVPIQAAPRLEEFQVVQNRDWKQRFYPVTDDVGAEIMGPTNNHGRNWRVRIPKDCKFLSISWDTKGSRRLTWKFLGGDKMELQCSRGPRGALPRYFLVGTWDLWHGCEELAPMSDAGPPYRACVEVVAPPHQGEHHFVEFQVLQDQNWDQRFYPSYLTRGGILGPDKKHGQNWRGRVPMGSRWLHVVWDPRGKRSLEWHFTASSGEVRVNDRLKVGALAMPDELGVWRPVAEIGRGWAGGVVYKAERLHWGPLATMLQKIGSSGFLTCPDHAAWAATCREVAAAISSTATWDPVEGESAELSPPRSAAQGQEDAAPAELGPCRSDIGMCLGFLGPKERAAVLAVGRSGALLATLVASLDSASPGTASPPATLLGRVDPGLLRRRPVLGSAPGEAAEQRHFVAAKYPVDTDEVRIAKRLHGVQGVPEVLDNGTGPDGDQFLVMPLLGPSLDEVLRQRDHDGLGGRLSWPVAKFLGGQLLQVLQAVHSRHVVHCDIKPGNVLLGKTDSKVYLIDFGSARLLGCSSSREARGTLPYNSIQVGYGGQRLPIDDVESLGWLLLRCVLGRLPWEGRNVAAPQVEAEQWQEKGEGMSLAKEMFLANAAVFGEEFNHCPADLREYFRHCHTQAEGGAGPDYGSFSRLLAIDALHWDRFVAAPGWTLYMAVRGVVVWRSDDDHWESGQDRSAPAPYGALIRTTGASRAVGRGGIWLQVDPVWAPQWPVWMSAASTWLLLASAKDSRPYLVPREYVNSAVKTRT